MKFEFDHKTGMMRPKKDDEIYFAKSQGGGLIIDDKKHNIKFIIERDGKITKLFGNFDKDRLNFYDMRDARIIADRVIRMFGSNHKYTDFHYFLKGYMMKENVIKNCSDFLEESIWGDVLNKSMGEIKKEDGRVIGKLGDDTKLILSNTAFSDGTLVDFDGENILNFWGNLYIAIITDGETDYFYAFDEDKDIEDGDGNMTKCFEVSSSLRTEYDLKPLRAIIHTMDDWDEDTFFDMNIRVYKTHIDFEPSKWISYVLYFDREDAISDAISIEEDLLETTKILKDDIKRWKKYFGNDFINMDWFKEYYEEYNGSYFDELREDEAIDELLNWRVIEDTEEYFDLDEDGEIDHTQPKFDYHNYKDKYVEKRLDDIDDFVEEYISDFGCGDEVVNQIYTHKLAELIVNEDGPESTLSDYDNMERVEEIDGTTYYIYRKD